MESRNRLTMCRLCLCENECFINIFELNDWQGYIAAEVISDVLQFKVSKTDFYPHVVCLTCLTKLTDFKEFKECCQMSKVVYDDMIASSETLVKHHLEEEASLAGSGVELCEEDPLDDASSHVEQKLLEAVTHPEYQQCMAYKRSQCTSKGDIDANSCSLSIHTNDKPKNNSLSEDVVASSSRTTERLEGERIMPGKSMYMASFFQKDINIGKEVKKEKRRTEEDVREEGEGWRITGIERGERERREGLECSHCGIVLLSKFNLKKHMKVHGFVNSYDCGICGEVFRCNSKLKRHILTHTGAKLYICAECNDCFSEINDLKRHIRLHTGCKQNKCTECSKYFSQNDDLKKHMRTHIGLKPFKCAECSKCFKRNYHLKVHMQSHTDYKPYKCAECSKCFRQNGNLLVHMRSHTGYKPYKCAECSRSFGQISDLKRHNRVHTGSKPYKCAECGKCFTQNGSLKIHMRLHTGSKPYKCTVCSKSFSRNDGLKTHMTIHAGS